MVQYSPVNEQTGIPTLFDELVLPEPPINPGAIGLEVGQLRAAWTIDKPDLIDFLCLKTMGMCLAYPDAEFMRKAIGTWSRSHIHEWQRLFDTLFYKYNPLWNKDGTISESGWDHAQDNGHGNSSGSAGSAGTATDFVHGYDGGVVDSGEGGDGLTWSHSDKTKTTGSNNYSNQYGTSDVTQSSFDHTTTERGNIGVTKTSELIQAEREVALYNFDEYIADEFMKMFCLQVW